MSSPVVGTVIKIRLFARFAELAGAEWLEIPAEGIGTVAELLAHLRTLPHGIAIARTALVAVNRSHARLPDRIGPGDEIALLPPLSGG